MSAVIALELRYLQKQNSFKQLHLIMLKKYKKVLSIYESISFLSVFPLRGLLNRRRKLLIIEL